MILVYPLQAHRLEPRWCEVARLQRCLLDFLASFRLQFWLHLPLLRQTRLNLPRFSFAPLQVANAPIRLSLPSFACWMDQKCLRFPDFLRHSFQKYRPHPREFWRLSGSLLHKFLQYSHLHGDPVPWSSLGLIDWTYFLRPTIHHHYDPMKKRGACRWHRRKCSLHRIYLMRSWFLSFRNSKMPIRPFEHSAFGRVFQIAHLLGWTPFRNLTEPTCGCCHWPPSWHEALFLPRRAPCWSEWAL